MFGEGGNIGQKYDKIRINLWSNLYLKEVQSKLLDQNIEFETNYEKISKGLISFGMLFSDDVIKKKFYE